MKSDHQGALDMLTTGDAGRASTGATATRSATAERPGRWTEKVSEVVAREIVHDIVSRGLKPGTVLPSESSMLSTYRVGRASLREALRILEVQGLISIKPGPGGGPVVGQVQSSEFGRMMTLYLHMAGATFRELMETRLAIEPVMARLAAQRRDPAFHAQLRATVDDAIGAPLDDSGQWMTLSTRFHSLVAGISGNRVLDLLGQALKDIYYDRTFGVLVMTVESREEVRAAHDAIARAILEGDSDLAERLMRKHMEDFLGFVERRHPGLFDEVVDWR